jgi:deoxyribonucleoside regulator
VRPMVKSDVRVVQGVGWESTSTLQRTLRDLVSELAHRIEASAIALPAPSVVASDAVRSDLEVDSHIGDTLRMLGALDTLYVELSSSIPAVEKTMAEQGSVPVGHIAHRHFDQTGRLLGTCADGHVVGITVDQMRRAAHVVALAHGPVRVHAIAAARSTGLIHTLITDELTARALAALRRSEVEPIPTPAARNARSLP